MLRRVVRFSGNNTDTAGLPVPYHVFDVISSRHPIDAKASIVTIVPIVENPPARTTGSKSYANKNEKEALKAAIQGLKDIPELGSLRFEEF